MLKGPNFTQKGPKTSESGSHFTLFLHEIIGLW